MARVTHEARMEYVDWKVHLVLGKSPRDSVYIERIRTPRQHGKNVEPLDWTVYVITKTGDIDKIMGIAWYTERRDGKRKTNFRGNNALLYPGGEKERELLLESLDYIDLLEKTIESLGMGEHSRPLRITSDFIEKYHGIESLQEYYEQARGEPESEYREIAGERPGVWVHKKHLEEFYYHILKDKRKHDKPRRREPTPYTLKDLIESYIPIIELNAKSLDPCLEEPTIKLRNVLGELIIEEYGEWALNPDLEEEIREFVENLGEKIEPLASHQGEKRKPGTIQAKLALEYED